MKPLKTAVLFAALLAAAPAPRAQEAAPAAPALTPGYRALAVPVEGAQTLFLSAGDRVDLLITFEAVMKGDRKEMVTATILQNIVVLEVARADAPEGLGVVRLLLNPNEAQYASLSLAQAKKLNIVRRAPGDRDLHPMEIATFKRLFR